MPSIDPDAPCPICHFLDAETERLKAEIGDLEKQIAEASRIKEQHLKDDRHLWTHEEKQP